MRRWFRRFRLAVAGLLFLLAVGLLVAWGMGWQWSGSLTIRSGPKTDSAWLAGLSFAPKGIATTFVWVVEEDESLTLVVALMGSANRIHLGDAVDRWVRIYCGFDASPGLPTVSLDVFQFRFGDNQRSDFGMSYAGIHVTLLAPILLLFAFLLAFAPIRRKLQKRYRVKSGLCLHCGYNLAGVEGEHCPECGADRSMVTFHRGEA